jgi:hypothetical protein
MSRAVSPGRLVLYLAASALVVLGVNRSALAQAPASITITIRTPEPRTFQLALDEVELDWSERDPNRQLSRAATAIANTRIAIAERARAVMALTSVGNMQALAARSAALEAANPGAEAHYVLYEPGERRAQEARALLTARTAVLLEDDRDPSGVLAEYAARNPQPIEGVPGGFLLQAADPLSAVDLAEALRVRIGVRVAYPLLERQLTAR